MLNERVDEGLVVEEVAVGRFCSARVVKARLWERTSASRRARSCAFIVRILCRAMHVERGRDKGRTSFLLPDTSMFRRLHSARRPAMSRGSCSGRSDLVRMGEA